MQPTTMTIEIGGEPITGEAYPFQCFLADDGSRRYFGWMMDHRAKDGSVWVLHIDTAIRGSPAYCYARARPKPGWDAERVAAEARSTGHVPDGWDADWQAMPAERDRAWGVQLAAG